MPTGLRASPVSSRDHDPEEDHRRRHPSTHPDNPTGDCGDANNLEDRRRIGQGPCENADDPEVTPLSPEDDRSHAASVVEAQYLL